MPSTELLTETIHVGDIVVELDTSGVSILPEDEEALTADDYNGIVLTPTTRREANQWSMALRKASQRLEVIARNLPATDDRG